MNAPVNYNMVHSSCLVFILPFALKKARRWTMKGGPPVAVATALY